MHMDPIEQWCNKGSTSKCNCSHTPLFDLWNFYIIRLALHNLQFTQLSEMKYYQWRIKIRTEQQIWKIRIINVNGAKKWKGGVFYLKSNDSRFFGVKWWNCGVVWSSCSWLWACLWRRLLWFHSKKRSANTILVKQNL